MGKLLSLLIRPVKTYNIEARAHKVISKDKPTVAPSYPSTIKDIERANQVDPGAFERQQKKDVQLDKHLKDVYVISHDPVQQKSTVETEKKRPLPLLRNYVHSPEYGYVEPELADIPAGKFTLKQALKFLAEHQSQPQVYTVEDIARDYKIDVKVAENVAKYFKMFELYIPKKIEEEKGIGHLTLLNVYGKFKELSNKINKTDETTETSHTKESSTNTPTIVRSSQHKRGSKT